MGHSSLLRFTIHYFRLPNNGECFFLQHVSKLTASITCQLRNNFVTVPITFGKCIMVLARRNLAGGLGALRLDGIPQAALGAAGIYAARVINRNIEAAANQIVAAAADRGRMAVAEGVRYVRDYQARPEKRPRSPGTPSGFNSTMSSHRPSFFPSSGHRSYLESIQPDAKFFSSIRAKNVLRRAIRRRRQSRVPHLVFRRGSRPTRVYRPRSPPRVKRFTRGKPSRSTPVPRGAPFFQRPPDPPFYRIAKAHASLYGRAGGNNANLSRRAGLLARRYARGYRPYDVFMANDFRNSSYF